MLRNTQYILIFLLALGLGACKKKKDLLSPVQEASNTSLEEGDGEFYCANPFVHNESEHSNARTEATPVRGFNLKEDYRFKGVIKVAFLNGDEWQRNFVMNKARLWSNYANVTFEISPKEESLVRIEFGKNVNSSVKGTDNYDVPKTEATMHLATYSKYSLKLDNFTIAVLHEFGHVLGFAEEQQRSDRPFKIDEKKAIAYYKKAGYSEEKARRGLLFIYQDRELIMDYGFDPESIMLYTIPQEILISGTSTSKNSGLSEKDKITANNLYKFPKEPNILYPGQSITVGNKLSHYGGNVNNFELRLQTDGNLVLYPTAYLFRYVPKAIWASNTQGKSPNMLKMDLDGVLRLYDGNNAVVWHAPKSTIAVPGSFAKLQSDGNFVVYKNSKAIWASNTRRNITTSFDNNMALNVGEYITSPNGQYKLIFQEDNNLVLYENSTRKVRWNSNTYSDSPDYNARVEFNNEGDLILDSKGVSKVLFKDINNQIILRDDGCLYSTSQFLGFYLKLTN